MRSYYKQGSHNFECRICQDWLKADQKRIRWDGLIVCRQCWDPKPWFLYKYPKVEDLKPVKNPSPPAPYTINPITWDISGYTWDTWLAAWGTLE